MARRKRAFLEDDLDSSDDSQEDQDQEFDDKDPDARDERRLFEDPYQRKKRRRINDDEDDDDDEGFGRKSKPEKRLHFTQAPSFVTGEAKMVDLDESLERNEDDSDDSESNGTNEEASEDDYVPKPEPPAEEPEPEENPRVGLGGIGSGIRRGGIGIGVGAGIGSGKAGLGSNTSTLNFKSATKVKETDANLPRGFGNAARQQKSFLRNNDVSGNSSKPGTPILSREEHVHFSKISSSIGAKLMSKMGWQAGTGLGLSGEGIVTPVETKLRPKPSMGLAFKGFKEKTAQSKAEARRRGEVVSEDEGEAPRRNKGQALDKTKSDAWKKPKKVKVKVEHQTYEQILQRAGQDVQLAGVGKIYDATGGEMREVSSLAEISTASWTPSTDATRIPEIRHNLRLIVDVAKGDLDGLAREAKSLEERKRWIQEENVRLSHKVQEEAELISRLQNIHLIIDEIKATSQSSEGDYEPSLEAFTPHIEKLVNEFSKEYEVHCLDEIVVAAIAPAVRVLLTSWQPLREPTFLVGIFKRWRRALKFSVVEEKNGLDVDIYASQTVNPAPAKNLVMLPFESLMWDVWLPKVRSCINNDWSAADAEPAIRLYEAWSGLLPPFIRDNVLDQLILPKIQKGISEWQPRVGYPALQAIVFPWLPHVGLRMEELLGDAKRKVKSLLRSWMVRAGIPNDLVAWKDVFGKRDWDSMILKYIVPKLGATLREDFKVNPRQQDMAPLESVLLWRPLLRASVFSQLLETEFFPKWLDVLHIWLIQPNASFEEVAQWYAFWKATFPQEALDMPGIANGFTRGLQLMNKAIELGPAASSKLPRPDHFPGSRTVDSGSNRSTPVAKARPASSRTTEITFRSIVEEFAASHDLLFVPTGRAHEKSRMPLFRVSHNVEGKGGILVYVLDDAVWAADGDDYRAISLEDMVLRANKTR
ncbi:TFP11-domain-containing protein [Hysterangium stoloniferum]|nr:TFP11-domain-containing protein [Hysterangium stoloniferum]